MFRVICSLLCLTCSVFISVDSKESCDTLGTLIYEDLGCRSVKKDARGCSIQYECDDFTQANNSCVFRGKTYGINEEISNKLVHGSCYSSCFCHNSVGHPEFMCGAICCSGYSFTPGCYEKYELDECCSVGINCPSEHNPLEECNVNGKKYKEGEKFYPKNTCYKCVCGKGWNGSFESPFCKRHLCDSQINNVEKIHKKCAPVYFSKGVLCCPDTWVCPSSSDHITKINNNVDSDSDVSCIFGSKTLKLGEGFQTKAGYFEYFGPKKDVQCECIIPPLLTCKEI